MALEDPEQLKLLRPKNKGLKYGNQKVTLHGVTYDSKAEAAYSIALGGLSYRVKPQFKFRCGVKYTADFAVLDENKALIVHLNVWYSELCRDGLAKALQDWPSFRECVRIVDVKGMMTRDAKIGMKMLKDEYGIDVEIVKMNTMQADALIKAHQGALSL